MRYISILACLAVVALSTSVKSQTVDWGTSYSVNPLAYTSDGSVDDMTLTWQLGWFNDGFIPDQENYLQWAVNWNPVDTNYHRTHALESGAHWSVSGHVDNVGEAAGGKQEYIFAFNDLLLIGTPDGEAFLARQDGTYFPTGANANVFDIADFPGNTNDDAFTVIWGRVDRDMYNAGGLVEGGGVISSYMPDSTAQPPDMLNGTFEVQSATWPVTVPEPSSALLIGLTSLLGLTRRRRPVTQA